MFGVRTCFLGISGKSDSDMWFLYLRGIAFVRSMLEWGERTPAHGMRFSCARRGAGWAGLSSVCLSVCNGMLCQKSPGTPGDHGIFHVPKLSLAGGFPPILVPKN